MNIRQSCTRVGPYSGVIQLNPKGPINLVVADPQEFFKQHLIKNEEQPSFSKRYSAHFGKVSTM